MPSVVIAGATSSWEELEDAAQAMSARLAGAAAMAVVMHPSIDAVTAVLAGLAAGVPVVPVSPDSTSAERGHLLADSGSVLLVDGGEVIDLPGAGGRAAPGPGTALVLYTSGTTGPPKGVPISRGAIEHGIAALAEAWQWSPDDTLVHGLPLYHVHGLVLGVLGARQVGCRLHHTGRPTPAAYAAAGGSLYFGVPTVWTRVARDQSAARALGGARLLVSGSAALPLGTFMALAALAGQAPIERYGMTETLITLSARADGQRVQGTVGHPVGQVSTRLVGEDGGLVAEDGESIGELQVRGSSVFAGYLGRADATAAAFTPDGWFRTGDIASVTDDGTHRIVGRASTDLITSGGYRIGAGEVEDALLEHPAVDEVAVVGEPDDDLGQRVVAYVVATGVTADELAAHAAARIARHKCPRLIHLVGALPRNAMGKVEKSRLGQ